MAAVDHFNRFLGLGPAVVSREHGAGRLGELDDAGLIRLRGDVSTQSSCVELTGAGERALDGID